MVANAESNVRWVSPMSSTSYLTDLDRHDPSVPRPLLIGGEWVSGDNQFEVCSPYDGAVVATVTSVGAAATREAVDAATTAMTGPLAAYERADILMRAAQTIRREVAGFAHAIALEAGKPIRAATAEVGRAAMTLELSAVEARKLRGSAIPLDATEAGVGKIGFTLRLPVGVVAAISPFNFPLNLVAHKVGPALAAGCAVVLKPARQTPVSALMLGEVFQDAGLPAGWLNVIAGPSTEIGDALVADDRVKLISFTGSAGVGWDLARRAARKRVKLELGNTAPVIVADDADIADAATKTAANAYSNAGQSCISIQRVYVHKSRVEHFLAELRPRVAALKVGNPLDEGVDVGPVIDRSNRDRILSWIKDSGGEVIAGGDLTSDGIIRPTIICEPDPDAQIVREEVFGPVCTVSTFDRLDDAIDAANSTAYGLQAAIFTADYRTAVRACRALNFGAVIVNEAPTWRADQMPYGGTKDSGNTKEGPAYAVADMTEDRLVVLNL